MLYLVRKKKFRLLGEVKELYFAVQRKLQKKSGKTEEDLAYLLAEHRSRGVGERMKRLLNNESVPKL